MPCPESRPTLRQRLLLAAITGVIAATARAATQRLLDYLITMS